MSMKQIKASDCISISKNPVFEMFKATLSEYRHWLNGQKCPRTYIQVFFFFKLEIEM